MSEVMCDRDPSQPAVFRYLWDWGEDGAVCAQQAVILKQIADQTGRGLTLSPLSNEPPPMTVDERRDHHARRLALEEEVAAAKGRGTELYRVNQQLARELRAERARIPVLEQDLETARAEVAEQAAVSRKLQRECDEHVAEIQRLKSVAALVVDSPDAEELRALAEMVSEDAQKGHKVEGKGRGSDS